MGIDCASEKKIPNNTSRLCLNVFLVDQTHLETTVARVRCWGWMRLMLSCPALRDDVGKAPHCHSTVSFLRILEQQSWEQA